MKMALLSRESRARLDRINTGFNERVYSGEGAKEYDRTAVLAMKARRRA
jgi:hypothetical protein